MKSRTFIIRKAICLATLAFPLPATAADLIVEENGVLPNYSTIQAAVTAAMPGDRIFVKNKAGGIPYQENVLIGKPLELLSFDAIDPFIVFGHYTINPASPSFSMPDDAVRIIGMHNLNGQFLATVNNPAGPPIQIQIFGCRFDNGSINVTGTNYVSHIAGNWILIGGITVREGTITGNQTPGITVNDAAGVGTPGVETL